MKTHSLYFIVLFVLLIASFMGSLFMGSVQIPVESIIDSLLGNEVKKSWSYIVTEFRFPKALVAILVGIALSITGMFMQTLFRNPMADSYVLGISSGSSLGVALVLMGATLFPISVQQWMHQPFAVSVSAILGSLLVMNLIVLVAKRFSDTNSLLIVGLMFSSFTSAFVSILAYFSSAEELQRYTFWSMGSLGNVSWTAISILAFAVIISLGFGLRITKALNALLLGEMYAQTMGIDIQSTRKTIVWISCILCGITTAFVGPIAFVGLAVPHISRMLFRTQNHFVLFFSNVLVGAILLLFCDMVSQIPGTSVILPINAITSLIGAPIVISLILKKR